MTSDPFRCSRLWESPSISTVSAVSSVMRNWRDSRSVSTHKTRYIVWKITTGEQHADMDTYSLHRQWTHSEYITCSIRLNPDQISLSVCWHLKKMFLTILLPRKVNQVITREYSLIMSDCILFGIIFIV